MKVYLVRHGDAVSSQFDPQRPLSEQGRADIQKVASFIKPLGISVEHVWHSGKLRAAQTAEILAGAVLVEEDCSAHEGLRPNDDVTIIAEEPKVDPRRQAIRSKIAEILGLNIGQVSVKATTTEGLGFTGRREGMAAQAVASIRMAL